MPFDIRPFTRLLVAALVTFATFSASTEVLAQVRTVGGITGTVTDPDGNTVPGATVALRDEGTNITRETVSNEQGAFRFLDLQAGSYEVTVTLTGFQATAGGTQRPELRAARAGRADRRHRSASEHVSGDAWRHDQHHRRRHQQQLRRVP
jgi:hypothetical protein